MITVINPGLLTTVQDEGRWGYQRYGMPVAGVMDRFAYRTANLLAGNDSAAAVLEMTMLGGTFYFESSSYVALCGADMQAELNGTSVSNWSAFFVPAGSELSLGFAVSGCRSYLAVQGGFNVPQVLGSRSTYVRGGIGGHSGRQLKAGDNLSLSKAENISSGKKSMPAELVPQYPSEITLRVLLGPQDDLFTDEGIETIFSSSYDITDEADRMGYRLEGPVIRHCGKADIVSDALCQGAIQVPGHGRPIIMMADRQTTGGYAKIGTVIGPDLAKLAQAKPGDSIRFVRCSDQEAVAALTEEANAYENIATAIASQGQNGRQMKVTVNGQVYLVSIEEA